MSWSAIGQREMWVRDKGLVETKRTKGKAKIFLFDDHPVVRVGLAHVISKQRGMAVCGEAATVGEALRQIPILRPNLAVLDLSLAGVSAFELIKQLRSQCPDVSVLVLSMHDERLYAERVLRAGAKGYIMKHEAIADLEKAIHSVLDGKIYLSDRASARLLGTLAGRKASRTESPVEPLSDREREVFELIGRGLMRREIATRLHLSARTIDTYRARLKLKLNVTSSADVGRAATAWVEGL